MNIVQRQSWLCSRNSIPGFRLCLLVGVFWILLSGCRPALPPLNEDERITKTMESVSKQVSQAKLYAAHAQQARIEAERMLKEARSYLEQSLLTRDICQKRVKVVNKCPKVTCDSDEQQNNKQTESKKKETINQAPISEVKESPVLSKPPVVQGPIDNDYSPSDRPPQLPLPRVTIP